MKLNEVLESYNISEQISSNEEIFKILKDINDKANDFEVVFHDFQLDGYSGNYNFSFKEVNLLKNNMIELVDNCTHKQISVKNLQILKNNQDKYVQLNLENIQPLDKIKIHGDLFQEIPSDSSRITIHRYLKGTFIIKKKK